MPLPEEALEHWPRVFGFAQQLVGDRTRAEDLCQEAYLRLLRSARPLDTSTSLLPLLLTVVRNLVRSDLRRVDPTEFAGEVEPEDDRVGDPAERAERAEESAAVEAALARMSPNWRAALYLADGLAFSYAEIADVLGTSDDVVRVMLHRARLRVRVLLRSRLTESL